ncbi:MAG: ATP-binding cassette domain-containing protein [Syntrophobacterales bacterium]|nr:ATP-binding cassette domain-containing protein [Syntrophobacterales bacterium]
MTVDFPLGRLTCVTGVSGSGKSTLVRDVLFRALKARIARRELPPVLEDLKGWEKVDHAKEVDESPIGRTPRSVPATYVGVMNTVRDIFAQTSEARARGYSPSRFSFNVASGQCPECEGHGHHRVRMALLPVVFVPCEACGGKRYNPDTLSITFKGKTVADVLEMSVDEAADFFGVFPRVVRPLKFLSEIGLGYMRLGQPSTNLSGGEAQRTKLASELALSGAGRSFYVLDEPTTGLHMADVAKLLSVIQSLVDRGDTVIVIEHDLDVIASADCVIDLGPEGGDGGGRVVAWGRPEDVAKTGYSRTAPFLREYLDRHR